MKINKIIKEFRSGRGNWRIYAIGSQILTCTWGDAGAPEPTDDEILVHIAKNYGGPASPGGWHVARPSVGWHARSGLEALAEGRKPAEATPGEFAYVERWVSRLFDGDVKAALAYANTCPQKPIAEDKGGDCPGLSI